MPMVKTRLQVVRILSHQVNPAWLWVMAQELLMIPLLPLAHMPKLQKAGASAFGFNANAQAIGSVAVGRQAQALS